MTPRDLLKQAQAEGVDVRLVVRVDGDDEPSPKTMALLEAHRDDLLIHLATQYGDTPPMCRLSEEAKEGARLCSRCWRYHLQACVPTERRFEEAD